MGINIFVCEVAIWLGALVFWLSAPSARHWLKWGIWFWLHPALAPAKARIEDKPTTGLWPGFVEYIARDLGTPPEQWVPKVTSTQYNALQNAYNAQQAVADCYGTMHIVPVTNAPYRGAATLGANLYGDQRWNQLLQNAATDPAYSKAMARGLQNMIGGLGG